MAACKGEMGMSSSPLPEEDVYPIFRVPWPLRSIAPQMFTPQMVAIGPLHSPESNEPSNPIYAEMDEFKLLSWQTIFKEDLTKAAPDFWSFLKRNQEHMLASYGGRRLERDYLRKAIDGRFIKGIALDACFIAAVLHSLFQEDFPYLKPQMTMEEISSIGRLRKSAAFYPIFSKKLSRPVQKAILQDLLLVENQIPLLALKQMIKIESKCTSDQEAETVLEFYMAALAHRVLPFSKSKKNVLSSVKNASSGAQHILDIMYSIVCMHREAPISIGLVVGDGEMPSYDPHVRDMPGANRLYMSGVQLHGHWGSLNELSFENGRLSVPKIHVGDDTERYFRNLIAYESCYKTDRLDILSYLHFMDFLIDTPADVDLLVESKIITETIGSNKKVAEMWNSLCRNTMCLFSPNYKAVADEVQSYCKSPWRIMWAEFYRSNLAKPWLVVSLLSAAALLIMTFFILWYTILLYRHETMKEE